MIHLCLIPFQWCVFEDLSSFSRHQLCPCPHPRSQVLVPETKSSGIILRTLINSVHYQFITNKLKKCWTLAIVILKHVMLVIGAHSLVTLVWCSWHHTGFSAWPCFLCNLRRPLFSTTVETSTTFLSTISLDQFGLKAYNFEVVHKDNIMKSLSQKLNLLSLELYGSQDVGFLFIWYFLALLDYISVVWRY